MTRRLLALSLAAAAGLAVPPGRPPAAAEERRAAKAATGSKLHLTPGSFAKLHALVRPQGHEWRHLKVRWLTDVVAARKKAAAEDKPILICYTGGAGYNEPLGVC
jgi:hypothetical protein